MLNIIPQSFFTTKLEFLAWWWSWRGLFTIRMWLGLCESLPHRLSRVTKKGLPWKPTCSSLLLFFFLQWCYSVACSKLVSRRNVSASERGSRSAGARGTRWDIKHRQVRKNSRMVLAELDREKWSQKPAEKERRRKKANNCRSLQICEISIFLSDFDILIKYWTPNFFNSWNPG